MELSEKDYDLIMFPYLREYNNRSIPRFTYEDNKTFNSKEIKEELIRKLVGPIGCELKRPEMMESNNTVWGKMYKRELLSGHQFIDFCVLSKVQNILQIFFIIIINQT